MLQYGDKVRHRATDKVGKVIGFMHMHSGDVRMLVQFDMDHELWINEIDLDKEDGNDPE